VNNAGIIRREPFADHSAENWNDVIATNLSAPFFLSQAAVRRMIAQGRGGKIIHVASMLSFQGGILVPGYAASKGGIKSLTMLMANELAPYGIRVNAIAPGYIATDNTAPIRADPARSQAISRPHPAGRWGTPEDRKGICVFSPPRFD
jgi:2-deoxy-D-gluconate 3-dehydrogenase